MLYVLFLILWLGNDGETELLRCVQPHALDKVYVVLNKADDSKERGVIKHKFQQNMKEFNETQPKEELLNIPDNNVFPLSSMLFNYTMLFEQYLRANPCAEEAPEPTTNQWRNFNHHLWGQRWEKLLKSSDISSLKEEVAEVAEASGMDPFLDNAIHYALRKAGCNAVETVYKRVNASRLLLIKRVNTQVELCKNHEDIGKIQQLQLKLEEVRTNVTRLQEEGSKTQQTAKALCIDTLGYVPWTETIRQTVYELKPKQLRAQVKEDITKMCQALDSTVIEHIDSTISTLFDPFFSAANKGINELTVELTAASKRLRESQAELETFKKAANNMLKDLANLDPQGHKILIKARDLR